MRVPPPPLPTSHSPQAGPTPPRRNFLAWWGLIPTVIFIAVKLTLGWEDARRNATAPQFAASYLGGGIVAGLLFSMVLGWLAYIVCRRSRTAGTVAFSAVMVLATAATVVQPNRPPSGGAAQQTAPSPTQSFPLFGVAVDSPPGWRMVPPDRPGVVTRWVSADSDAREVTGLIMVEARRAEPGKDLVKDAETLAKSWGGRVVAPDGALAGQPAVRIVGVPSGGGLQPVHGVVAIHDGDRYLVSGGVTPGHSCDAAFEHVVRNWKWIPIESPTRHLTFHPDPQPVLGGRLRVNYPAAMTAFDTGKPDVSFGISLHNFREHRPDFTAIVALADSPEDVFADRQARITAGLQQQFDLPEALAWRPLKSRYGNAGITQAVPGPTADKNGPNWIMWALIEPDPRHIVSINFTIYAPSPAERDIYAATAERIAQSITFETPPADETAK